MHIYIAGYPGQGGGADVELWHLIDMFRELGVRVTLVPMKGTKGFEHRMRDLGCETVEYHPAVFAGQVVLSLCDGDFLKRLPEIMAAGKPRLVIWGDCMARQVYAQEAHRQGWIDYHLFQSRYMRDTHKELDAIRPVVELEGYRPYFSQRIWNSTKEGCPTCGRDPNEFGIGRVSRDDPGKWLPDLWSVYEQVQVPEGKTKRAYVLGYGKNATDTCGQPPSWATCWPPYSIPAYQAFSKMRVMLYQVGTSGDNWPMVVKEAWASGVIPICDNRFGTAEMIEHRVDGFLVDTSAEAAEYASEIAHDEELRIKMVQAGRETLNREHSDLERCFAPFRPLLEGTGQGSPAPAAIPPVRDLRAIQDAGAFLNEAERSGRWAVSFMWVEPGGRVRSEYVTSNFPTDRIPEAVLGIATKLGAEHAKLIGGA